MYPRKYVKRASKYNAVAKRAKVYGPAAVQLVKDVAYLGSLINSEPKYHITTLSDNINFNGLMTSLSSIPQGDGTENRDGNSVLPRYLNAKFRIKKAVSLPVSSTLDSCTVRVIFFRWYGNSAQSSTPPTPSEVLNQVGTTLAPYSFLDDDITGSRGDRQRRIEILKSDMFTLDTVTLTHKDYDINFQMNGPQVKNKQHLKFLNSGTGPGISGAVYLLVISSNDPASSPTDLAINGQFKLVFYDN